MAAVWCVYVVRCGDGSLYTGIAIDVVRRVAEHNDSNQLAAKYTRVRRPVVLVYQEQYDNRAAAARREYAIKRMRRSQKMVLIGEATADSARSTVKG